MAEHRTDRVGVIVPPLVRRMLEGTDLFQNPAADTDPDAQELRRAVLATSERQPVYLSRNAAGHLADYCDVALLAATDDGTSAERAAYRRTIGRLIEQGIEPL